MTNLRCSAGKCAHNAQGCCCKSEIIVDGKNAHKSEETCCASFQEEGIQSTNSAGYISPNMSVAITCNASDCTYNENHCCGASSACVNSTLSGTECSSFKKR